MYSEDYVMDKINYWQNELKKIHSAIDRGQYDNNQFTYRSGYRNRSTFKNLNRRYGRSRNG